MKNNESKNPFWTGSPAEPDYFFGRSDILKEIFFFLDNPNQSTFIINGLRRIGKTSLLLKIEKEIKAKDYSPVYFDLQDNAELSMAEILYKLMMQINVDIRKTDFLARSDFEKDINVFEAVYLKQILGEKKNIVLLFDEFESLGDKEDIAKNESGKNMAYVGFIPYLQKIISKRLPIKFIFAIGRSPGDLAEYYGRMQRFAQVSELKYFDEDESKNLISTLTNDRKIKFSEETIREIHRITAGYPHFLQCLASFLFDQVNGSSGRSVEVNDVKRHIEGTIELYRGSLLWFWGGFKPAEKVYLYIIALLMETGVDADEKTIMEKLKTEKLNYYTLDYINMLKKLLKLKVLRVKKDVDGSPKYEITIPFIQKWILTLPPNFIKDDIKDLDDYFKRHLARGKEYIKKEKYRDAIADFKRILKLVPDHSEAQCYLALSQRQISNSKGDIIREFQRAYKLDPDFIRSHFIDALEEFYEATKEKGYLLERLKIEKNDHELQRIILVDHFFREWGHDFENEAHSAFQDAIKMHKWILRDFKPELDHFFEATVQSLVDKRKADVALRILNQVSDVIDINNLMPKLIQAKDEKSERRMLVEKERAYTKGRTEGEKIAQRKTDAEIKEAERKLREVEKMAAISKGEGRFSLSRYVRGKINELGKPFWLSTVFFIVLIDVYVYLSNLKKSNPTWLEDAKDLSPNFYNLLGFGFAGVYGEYNIGTGLYVVFALFSLVIMVFALKRLETGYNDPEGIPRFLFINWGYVGITILTWGLAPMLGVFDRPFSKGQFPVWVLGAVMVPMLVVLVIKIGKVFSLYRFKEGLKDKFRHLWSKFSWKRIFRKKQEGTEEVG